MRDVTGASPIDYVTKRNLFFCNSIIEICLRNYERNKSRQVNIFLTPNVKTQNCTQTKKCVFLCLFSSTRVLARQIV